MLGAGALGQLRGMVWRGRREEGLFLEIFISKKEKKKKKRKKKKDLYLECSGSLIGRDQLIRSRSEQRGKIAPESYWVGAIE